MGAVKAWSVAKFGFDDPRPVTAKDPASHPDRPQHVDDWGRMMATTGVAIIGKMGH